MMSHEKLSSLYAVLGRRDGSIIVRQNLRKHVEKVWYHILNLVEAVGAAFRVLKGA